MRQRWYLGNGGSYAALLSLSLSPTVLQNRVSGLVFILSPAILTGSSIQSFAFPRKPQRITDDAAAPTVAAAAAAPTNSRSTSTDAAAAVKRATAAAAAPPQRATASAAAHFLLECSESEARRRRKLHVSASQQPWNRSWIQVYRCRRQK